MECPFQVGDPVVCVEELGLIERVVFRATGPKLDEIYHIRSVFLCNCGRDHILVRLKEIILPQCDTGEQGFSHFMFRKLLTIEDFMSRDISTPVNSEDKVPEHV